MSTPHAREEQDGTADRSADDADQADQADPADQADRATDAADEGGQVSEVDSLAGGGAGEQIMPDQAVAGSPEAESGEVDEGTAGPNARPRDNRPGERE